MNNDCDNCRGRACPCPRAYIAERAGTSPAPTITANGAHAFASGYKTTGAGQANKPRGNAGSKGRGEAVSKRDDAATRKLRRAAERQRQQAVAALTETADAARRIEDLDSRARIQTLAADALWPADEASARAYFRRAWESATAFDHAEQEAARADTGTRASEVFTEARDDVLTRVAARDPRLADIFLQEIVKEKTADDGRLSEAGTGATEPQARRRTAWRELSANGQQRLGLALALLNQHDARQASQIAAPLVEEGASAQLVSLLLQLRRVGAVEADALYLRLLQKTLSDARADANDVLLLSSYVVSPELLVVVDERGALLFRATNLQPATGGSKTTDEAHPSVRRAFFETAASVLLRPPTPPDGDANQPHVAPYFAIGRLLPFFEREAPGRVPELQARLASLANELDANRRERLASQSGVQSVTPKNPTDPLRPQLDNLARVRDPQLRDLLRLRIAKTAAQRRLWERARSLAAQIETDEIQRAARLIIALHQIKNLARDFKDDSPHDASHDANTNDEQRAPDDFERAATFVRQLDAPPAARAYGLAQAAMLAAERGARARAAELLEEAARLAETSGAGTHERVAALGLVALAAARLDTRRAFELLPSVVGAINAVEDFTGDVDTGGDASVVDAAARDVDDAGGAATVEAQAEAETELDDFLKAFRLGELFATMGRLDFARALDEARALKRETPRAFAVVAMARAALDERATKHVSREAR